MVDDLSTSFDAFTDAFEDAFDITPEQGRHTLLGRESHALAQSEHDLWQDPETVSEEAMFRRTFQEKKVPQKRRKLTLKSFVLFILKAIIFLLVCALVATLVWSVIYMIGSQTPIADMPSALLNFFTRLFA